MTPWVRRSLASALFFLLTPVAALGAVLFEAPLTSDLSGPGTGAALLIADVDRDCFVDALVTRDLAVASETPGLNIVWGLGSGDFPDGTVADIGRGLNDVHLADFDGDGVDDLVATESFEPGAVPQGVCQATGPRVPVFFGDATGGLTLATCLVAKDHPSGAAPGDFDEDGIIDLIVINARNSCCGATSRQVLFFAGLGGGAFGEGQHVFDRSGDEVEAVDVDGDGHLDLVIAGGASVYVHYGNGLGSFTATGSGVTGAAYRVATGDVDGDGDVDLLAVGSAAASGSDDVLWLARNVGGASFTVSVYPVGGHPVDVQVDDLDGDGLDDVVVANYQDDSLSILLGQASGVLAAESPAAAGPDPTAVAIADVNHDGIPDLVVANRNEDAGELSDGTLTTLLQVGSMPLDLSQSLPDGLLGAPYHHCLVVRGGDPLYAWSVTAGSLPDGLSLDAAAGRIGGVPTVAGISEFVVEVEDSVPNSATAMLTLRVCEDQDGDAIASCDDCDDSAPSSWALPGEARNLVFLADGTTLLWLAPDEPGSTLDTIRYDVLRSENPADFGSGLTCVSSNAAGTSAVDPVDPPATGVFHYLVRPENGCAPDQGDLGQDSSGESRIAGSCP
jgi:hypothetical protein